MTNLARCAFCFGTAAALLAACGGSQLPIRATNDATSNAGAFKHSKTFSYIGEKQSFTVPMSVTTITVKADGASGGGQNGGLGGRVKAAIPVKPGEDLVIFVGGTVERRGRADLSDDRFGSHQRLDEVARYLQLQRVSHLEGRRHLSVGQLQRFAHISVSAGWQLDTEGRTPLLWDTSGDERRKLGEPPQARAGGREV